jgi:glutamine amidotransferase
MRRRLFRERRSGICRWLAYSGSPVLLEELLYNRKNSLIVQSLHSRLGAEETNGDGFGLGWYGEQDTPGVFRSIEPPGTTATCASSPPDQLGARLRAHPGLDGSPVQQTNCHPFRHGRWLFMHNGFLDGFHDTKRDLVLAVDPALYPEIEGTTDTELMFHLALTFGLEDDPPQRWPAWSASSRRPATRTASSFRSRGRSPPPTASASGPSATRAEGDSRSLFFSTDLRTLRELYPEQRGDSRPRTTSHARSSRSRSATCPACGTRFPRPRTA